MSSVSDTARHVVLVHGAWHGGWCFSALQAELDRRGIPSYAIDLPGHGASVEKLGDLSTDAKAVQAFLQVLADRGISESVLVGHSYGGAVISQAAAHGPSVSSLIYLAAFALESGESVMSALGSFPQHHVALGSAIQMRNDGSSVLDPTIAKAALYGSCDDIAADAALSRLTPQPMATMAQALSNSALGSVPSTYVICSHDEAVHPVHQALMAQRCSQTITLETDHSPFLSMIEETASIIEQHARHQ